MAEYNASSTRDIARAKKESKQLDADRGHVILKLMSDPAGRAYMHSRLVRSHCFSSSFAVNALAMAFAEGERNIGLQDLNDIMQYAPDQYIAMMREATDKEVSDGRRTDDSGRSRSGQNGNGTDSGSESDPGIESDYEPGDEASS